MTRETEPRKYQRKKLTEDQLDQIKDPTIRRVYERINDFTGAQHPVFGGALLMRGKDGVDRPTVISYQELTDEQRAEFRIGMEDIDLDFLIQSTPDFL